MTDLDSPRKNNDCYFYYYSTCSKGDSCGFRHEPSALGCETMCSFWKQGKCLNVHCNFRHMELRKNRKAIACYWEAKPGGCLKPHCPFLHTNPRPMDGDMKLAKPEQLPENCTQAGKNTPSVESLVVNFEEESDTESAPSASPSKFGRPKATTLEELQLEQIAAETAAFYSYQDESNQHHVPEPTSIADDDLRHRVLQKRSREPVRSRLTFDKPSELPPTKRRKEGEKVEDIKIKTLDQIRTERLARQGDGAQNAPDDVKEIAEESEVSSTSIDEPDRVQLKPIRKLNIKKTIKEATKATKDEVRIEEDVLNTPTKLMDETLLLLDDADEDMSINVKSEDDLLGDIDSFLDD